LKILFKYPTYKRPIEFRRGIESILNNVVSDNFAILVSVDSDDKLMDYTKLNYKNTIVKVKPTDTSREICSKIEAINRDLELVTDWDVLVCMSDDMVFIEKGFDLQIQGCFVDNTANNVNLDQFLHFPDGNRKDLCTMSIIGRDYFERDKYIYYPEYLTECCDDEAQEVAKLRGCYKFIDKQIFEHRHVAYGKANWDANYQMNLQSPKQAHDRMLLNERRKINFGL
jgi:hypothetical protein